MLNLYWMLVRALGRGRLTSVDDAGPVQTVQAQLSQNELRDGTPRLAEYGFHSNPPPGADAVLVFMGGDRTQGVVIACGHQQYRMKGLATGEVALSDDLGQTVYLTRSGIVIRGAGLPMLVTDTPQITFDTPLVKMTGALEVAGDATVTGDVLGKQDITAIANIVATTGDITATVGDITAGGEVADLGGAKTMAGMREIFNAHTHPVPGVEGGPSTVNTNQPAQSE